MFHVLNRGNGRQTRFFETRFFETRFFETRCLGSADDEAFVRFVKEAWWIVPMRTLGTLGSCLMPCGPWVKQTARHLGLEATLRSPGRPRKKSSSQGNATLRNNYRAP